MSGKAQSFLVLGFGAETDREYGTVREKKRKEEKRMAKKTKGQLRKVMERNKRKANEIKNGKDKGENSKEMKCS